MKHLCSSVVVCAGLIVPHCSFADSGADFSFPEQSVDKLKKMSLWATYYYIYPAQEQKQGVALIDTNNQTISVTISKSDWCLGAIEGTI